MKILAKYTFETVFVPLLAGVACGLALLTASCAITDKAGITETVSTVNAATGETQTHRVLTEEAESVIEELTTTAGESGGLLGILGVAAGAAFGIWRRSKEKNALKTASAVIEGTSQILAKVEEVKNEDGTITGISKEDATALLKKIQEDEGVRESVKKLLAASNSTATASTKVESASQES